MDDPCVPRENVEQSVTFNGFRDGHIANTKTLLPSVCRKVALGWLLLAFLVLGIQPADAVTSYYWDVNGPLAGAGAGSSPNGFWEGTNWSTSSSGTQTTGAWVEGNFPRFCVGTGNGTATGTYTVTASSSHTITGLYNVTPGNTVINGPGELDLSASGAGGLAGFLVVQSVVVSNVIGETGGSCAIETEVAGGGQLYLYGSNTYSGGTELAGLSGESGVGTVYYGNNSAFGLELIYLPVSGATLSPATSAPYNIANSVYLAIPGGTENFAGNPSGVNFSGYWDLGGSDGPCTVAVPGPADNLVIISGSIVDTEPFIKSGGGTLILSGDDNTYGTNGVDTQIVGGQLILANTSGSATGLTGVEVANTTATLSGNGITTGAVDNSGNISATNTAGGTAALTIGSLTWEVGSACQWAVNNPLGTAGGNSGWDELVVNGGMTNNANGSNPVQLDVISLTSANVQGALNAFDSTRDYSWLIIHSTSPPISGFSTSAFSINSSSFANSMGSAVFSLTTNNTITGGDVFLNFVHAPVLALSNVTVNSGSNAVLSVSNMVVGSTPTTATYSWKSNNIALTDGGRLSGSATPNLTIANAAYTDDATYSVLVSNPAGSSSTSAILTVTATASAITWATPSSITYGTPLGAAQLNATANMPGTLVYNPSAGTVLNTGVYPLFAVFTPNDTTNFTPVTNTVNLTVTPATLTVTASNVARPLGAANPRLTGSIAGLQNGDPITATYSTSAGPSSPLGAYSIVPTLVDPNNRQTNYTVSLVNGTLDVGTIVTWANPVAITYGASLTSNQLDAAADVSGTFVYTPSAGTVLNSGTHTLSVVFTPTDSVDYSPATNAVSLVVSPAPLVISPFSVSRQSGSANPVFSGTILGLENGDDITATYSSSATVSSPPGTYSIVPVLVDPDNLQTNYAVTLLDGTLTVTPPPPPITAAAGSLIPLPVTVQTTNGTFTLCPSQSSSPVPAHALMQILTDGASFQTGQYLAATLFKSTGYQFRLSTNTAATAVKGAILITTSNALSTLGAEGYELTTAPDSVVIRAPAQGGTFYGVQSLLQLLPPAIYSPTIVTNVPWVAPCVYIKDYPAYSWRGAMLDPARHFINKQEVKQFMDAMAIQKLNVLHLHLVDDQGWRLEITNYPNLTALAAWRNGIDYGLPPRATTATNGSGNYGGFYTQADAREMVAYAAERHITVVPEIEMPCHSDAALYAYPQFSCGDSGYTMDYYGIQSLYGIDLFSLGTPGVMPFFREVISEVIQIFPSKYIHCGGDEVISSGDRQWNSYHADVTNMAAIGITPNGNTSIVQYQHWLSTNLAAFIQSKGRVMIGWSEYEAGGVVPNAAVMDWEATEGATVAEAGLPVVECPDTSPGLYVNYIEGTGTGSLPYDPPFVVGGVPSYSSLAGVYAFNPIPSGLPSQYDANILGAQCNAFAEYIPSFRNVMLKMFPRETALAEITWSPLASQSFSGFTNRLVTQEQRFNYMGVNYDHESIPQIGSWSGSPSATPTTTSYNITPNVTAAGEIDVSFWLNSGAAYTITSVALLVNGTQVDIDTHTGTASGSNYQPGSEPFIPLFTLYVLHLPETKPGATYTIQTVTQGTGSPSSGTVYLPNWN
jgi:hexosaminidase